VLYGAGGRPGRRIPAATKRKFPYLERGLEPTRGWINVMFVDEAYRRKGVGEALVLKAERN
jgi:GNAT superfamily N-acetyltransferase